MYGVASFCREHNSEDVEVIVPDKLSLFMEKFLFKNLGIESSFNLQVSTLNRFAKKSCQLNKDRVISKVGSILLIHKILNKNLDKLEILKNQTNSFSYAEDIFATLSQLKASKITFEEMKRFKSSHERLNSKIADLAFIYEEYENQKAGLVDTFDWFLMSAFTVGNIAKNKKIVFVGFEDFTAIQYSIIERLAVNTEVFVFNYESKSKNKHIFNGEVKEQLRNIAYINELPFEMEELQVQASNLKKFLSSNLFSLEHNNFVLDDEPVKVFSGNSVDDEIDFVAREIRSKILSGNRYDDFGVAVYNLEGNINKIKEIFEKYEINYYIDSEISLNKSVLYKFFASCLKYSWQGYSLSNLIDIINSPFVEIDESQKRELIEVLIKRNFKGKLTQSSCPDVEIKNEIVSIVNLVTIDKSLRAKEIVEKFRLMYEKLNMKFVLENLDSNVNNFVLMSKSQQAIFALLDDIARFYADADLKTFYDIFARAIGVVKISNLPLSLDAVKVVDADGAMELFKDLYIVGATYDKAPSLKFDCGIILDNEIEKLTFKNKLNPTIAHINKIQKLRLFNLLTMFEDSLVITYSNLPSVAIKELCDKLQLNTDKGTQNIFPLTKFSYGKHVALSRWDYIEKSYSWQKNNKIYEKYLKNNEKLIKNKDFLQISNKNLPIYTELKIISATYLENYFKCPFYAFLNNTIKIQPRLDAQILSLDIGNVLHEILYLYYQKNKNVGDVYEFCLKQVFEIVERDERLKLNADSPILTNLIDEAVRVINAINYIDDNSEFSPKYFEKSFAGIDALKLKNISVVGKVDRVDIFNDMFRIIDYKSGRADANLKELFYGNKLQLFLYSCAMESVLKKKAVGSFYLPLHNAYTKEIKNTYSLKGFYLAEDFVVKAFDKRLEPGEKSDIVNAKINKNGNVAKTIGYKELSSAELDWLKTYSVKVSECAVDEIKSGYILPSPSGVNKPCEFCPYMHICLKQSKGIVYREPNKVDLTSFEEVQDEGV